MMEKTFLILFLVTAAGAPAIGCKEAPTEAQPTSTANATAGLSAEVSARVDTALGDYEALRAALAGDRLGEVAAIATRLERSASAAKAGAPAGVASRLDEMGTKVDKMDADAIADRRRVEDLVQDTSVGSPPKSTHAPFLR